MERKVATKLGREIRVRRLARGMSRAELAIKLGCSEVTVKRWEAGRNFPEAESFQDLKAVLEFTTEELERHLRSKGRRIVNLAEAAEELGGWEQLYAAFGEILDDYPIPEGPFNEMGKPEKWQSIYLASPDTGAVIFTPDNRIDAYWHCVAVPSDIYKKILAGENVNDAIQDSDLEILTFPGTYSLYFVDLFARRQSLNAELRIEIFQSFIDFLGGLARVGVFCNRIAAHLTTTEIVTTCRKFGFRKVADHQTHRIFANGKSGAEVPSQIFELRLDSDEAQRFLQGDERLLATYRSAVRRGW